jgi:hypothetical protein
MPSPPSAAPARFNNSPQVTPSPHGHASHAHARALQQQAAAAHLAAAAASSSYVEHPAGGGGDPPPDPIRRPVAARILKPSTCGGRGAPAPAGGGAAAVSSGGSGPMRALRSGGGLDSGSGLASCGSFSRRNCSGNGGGGGGCAASHPSGGFQPTGAGVGAGGGASAGGGVPTYHHPAAYGMNFGNLGSHGDPPELSRLEVVSSGGSRPSTADSDATIPSTTGARGGGPSKRTSRTQKINQLSAMYGGSGGLASCRNFSGSGQSARGGSAGVPPGAVGAASLSANGTALSSRGASRGSGAPPHGGGSGHHHNPSMRPTRGGGSAPHERTNGCGASHAHDRGHAAAPQVNMLRIPTGLQPQPLWSAEEVDGADEAQSSSPLPFQSSLAPDFLALFANHSWDDE